MKLSCIVAASENDVIGRDNDLPWRLSSDLRRFKRLTMGHTIVMGRKTWDSLGRALPGRRSVVVSRQRDLKLADATVVHSLDEALAAAAGDDEVFVIGGEAIFALAIPRADRVYLTRVHAAVEGDVRLPGGSLDGLRLASEESHAAGERDEHATTFQVWERPRDSRGSGASLDAEHPGQ